MRGQLIDLTTGRDGRQRISVSIDGDFREQYDQLSGADVNVEIKKYRKLRSLDANAMLWRLCEKIAQTANLTKQEVYRESIRQVGKYTPLPIREDAIEAFTDIWSSHGTGWFIDVVDDSKLDGYKLVFAYHGSSVYDSAQMSRLIDNVIQDAKALGIDTMSDQERSLMMDAWALRE